MSRGAPYALLATFQMASGERSLSWVVLGSVPSLDRGSPAWIRDHYGTVLCQVSTFWVCLLPHNCLCWSSDWSLFCVFCRCDSHKDGRGSGIMQTSVLVDRTSAGLFSLY